MRSSMPPALGCERSPLRRTESKRRSLESHRKERPVNFKWLKSLRLSLSAIRRDHEKKFHFLVTYLGYCRLRTAYGSRPGEGPHRGTVVSDRFISGIYRTGERLL